MEEHTKKNYGAGAIALFVSGAAVGAATALLLAPNSGEETRRKLGQWLKEKREKGKEEFLSRKKLLAEALDAGKRAYKHAEKSSVGV